MWIVLLATLGLLVVGLGVLTGMGSRRRGAGVPVSVISAVFFPVAWVVWYLRDAPPRLARASRA